MSAKIKECVTVKLWNSLKLFSVGWVFLFIPSKAVVFTLMSHVFWLLMGSLFTSHCHDICRCRMKLKWVEKSPARCSHYILNRQLVVRPNFEFSCNIWRAASFYYGYVLRCYICNTICFAQATKLFTYPDTT